MKPSFQTLAADLYEVIVSDDGHDYPAEAFCSEHYPWVHYIRGPRMGPAANRNCGARIASGDWLVFTDDDCLPDAGWLQAYAHAIQQYPECKAFEGAILPDDWNLLKKDMAECPVNTEGGCFWSANIVVEKAVFDSLRGFDEKFILAAQEDQDLQKRLLLVGPIKFVKNAIVTHPVRYSNFKNKLFLVPASIANWLNYSMKYSGKAEVFLTGLRTQIFALGMNLRRSKWKSAFLNLTHIIYLPWGILFYKGSK